jgi:hypothetical protein
LRSNLVAAVERREQALAGELPPPAPEDPPEVARIAATLQTQEELASAKVRIALRLWMARVLERRGT